MLRFDKRKQVRKHRPKQEGYQGKERDLQEQCEQYLGYLGVPFLRTPDSAYHYLLSARSPIPAHIKKLIADYMRGVPDLILLGRDGRYLCVELKTAKGKQTTGQKQFERKVGAQNYALCRSFDTFMSTVRAWLDNADD